VREVEKQQLNAVLFEEAQDKYTQVAGELAADTRRVAHKDQNRGQGVTKAQYVDAIIAFMEKENTFVKMYTQWLDRAANVHLEDGSKQVCRLKQTLMPTAAARKYLTTITDVFLLNYAQSVSTRHVMGPKKVSRACGVVNCLLTVSRCSSWHLRLHSCPV